MLGIAALLDASPAKLNGILFGKSIVFDHVTVQKMSNRAMAKGGGAKDEADTYVFTFQQGSDLIYDNGIKFHVNVNPGVKLEKAKLVQPSVKFGTPEYSDVIHGHTTGTSCGRGAMAVFINAGQRIESASDQIKFKFFCKPLPNGAYKASIFAYNAEFKTGVQGSFSFKISKF